MQLGVYTHTGRGLLKNAWVLTDQEIREGHGSWVCPSGSACKLSITAATVGSLMQCKQQEQELKVGGAWLPTWLHHS